MSELRTAVDYHCIGTDTYDLPVRDAVAEIAVEMERKLRKHDTKTHWRKLPIEALRRLMMLEIEEYNVAREFFGPEEAMGELVDVINYAMMLRDRLRAELNAKDNN